MLKNILLDPAAGEMNGGGVGLPMGAPVPEPSVPAEAAVSPPPSDLPGFTDTGESGQAVPSEAAEQAAQWQSIRAAAQAMGMNLSQFPDDREALNHLIAEANRAKQANYYAQLGQQIAPHYQGVQEYLRQQQPAAQAQQQANPWDVPEFDARWLHLVDRDEATGTYVAKPGVNPLFAEKVQQFADWRQKFDMNPMAVIQPAIDAAVAKVKEELGQYQSRSQIGQIVEQNASWIFQADAQGRRVVDPNTGSYAYSPLGTRYIQHLQAVGEAGVRDPAQKDLLARQLLRGEIAIAQQTQSNGQVPAQVHAAQARPNVNPLQAQPPLARRQNPAATEPTNTGRSLADTMREAMAAEGITDHDFAEIG